MSTMKSFTWAQKSGSSPSRDTGSGGNGGGGGAGGAAIFRLAARRTFIYF